MATLRVVLDTKVLVSGVALPASPPGQIIRAWRQGALEIVLSRHIVDEVARVLPRLNRYLRWRDEDFLDYLDALAMSKRS